MEHESFENPEVARILNQHFVSIKVDREERPDLDDVYMHAVQLMTGSGGWPLSVFLTPDLQPFFGGTYFPPEERYGMPGFRDLLLRISKLWDTKHESIREDASRVASAVRSSLIAPTASVDWSKNPIKELIRGLKERFDPSWGGFGGAPKFPPCASLVLLLDNYVITGQNELLDMVRTTLNGMARGGVYDIVGGGFHRYSVDDQWLVPHFEKMLYDNAQLATVYLDAHLLTGDAHYARVARETLDYVIRDLTDGETGGFYSSHDADSEGVEGKYYVWTPAEIESVLGPEPAKKFISVYGVSDRGNFEGKNILRLRSQHEDLEHELAPLRNKLLQARERRVPPALDDKIVAAWNGLMISALCRGYQVLAESRYLNNAVNAAGFMWNHMRDDKGLLRIFAKGQGRIPAFLDDYAAYANALIDVYESTFDMTWLERADIIAAEMIQRFKDPGGGGFFYTAENSEELLVRSKPYFDGSTPSGNALAALALLRLSRLLDRPAYWERAEGIFQAAGAYIQKSPAAVPRLLSAYGFFQGPSLEVVIVGKHGNEDTRALVEAVYESYPLNRVVALKHEGVSGKSPLFEGREQHKGKATAYVCKNMACGQPITDPEELRKQTRPRERTGSCPQISLCR